MSAVARLDQPQQTQMTIFNIGNAMNQIMALIPMIVSFMIQIEMLKFVFDLLRGLFR